jgi:hypothetical protein
MPVLIGFIRTMTTMSKAGDSMKAIGTMRITIMTAIMTMTAITNMSTVEATTIMATITTISLR